MARRLFTLASAASSVLCVAVAVLWAWSYPTSHFVGLDFPRRPVAPGVVRFHVVGFSGGSFRVGRADVDAGFLEEKRRVLGFHYSGGPNRAWA